MNTFMLASDYGLVNFVQKITSLAVLSTAVFPRLSAS
jgi:uncharacterized protein with von Willebrand factor type A (vWA) domain